MAKRRTAGPGTAGAAPASAAGSTPAPAARPRRGAARGRIAVLALLLGAVLYVATNLFAYQGLRGVRLDLTERHIYTLNPASRSVLARIDEPITLRFYYSSRLGEAVPAYGIYATQVRELLEEYAAASGGKIRLEIYDPLPFSDEEDRAVAYGLIGVPAVAQGEPVYFGLVGTNTIDGEQTIPFFQADRQSELEYDITKLIYTLATPRRPVLGLLSTIPLAGGAMAGPGGMPVGGMTPPLIAYSRLQELFDVHALPTEGGGPIPSDVDALMLVHPHDLPPATLYAIDQYVMRGGRVLVLVDPFSEIAAQNRDPMARMTPPASTLAPFAASWGVDLVPDRVVGDRRAAVQVNVGGSRRVEPIDYLVWMQLRTDEFGVDDRVLSNLSQINMGSVGILNRRDDATTEVTPLILSSPLSMQIDTARLMFGPNPRQLLADFRPSGQRQVMAVRVRGPAHSAFVDGPPEGVVPEGTTAEAHRSEAVRPLDLVIIADTDFLDDRFWVNVRNFAGEPVAVPFADNDALVINAVESLLGTIDLSGLRGRATASRPFERIQELEAQADERFRANEQRLVDQLQATQQQLRSAQGAEGGNAATVSSERRAALDQLRARMIEVRTELRDVRRALREDVEGLKRWLEFVNIGLVPIAVALLALVLALFRAARRRRPSPA